MKKLLAYYVNPTECVAKPYGIIDELDCFYETLGCDTIDIVSRQIGGKYYDIICDDEALLKPYPTPSATGSHGTMLYNSLLVVGQADDEGELTTLTDADIEHLRAHTATGYTIARFESKVERIKLVRLTRVEY